MSNEAQDLNRIVEFDKDNPGTHKESTTDVELSKLKPAGVERLQDINDDQQIRMAKTEAGIVLYITDKKEISQDVTPTPEYIRDHRIGMVREGTGVYEKVIPALKMSNLEIKQNRNGEYVLVASTEDLTTNLQEEIRGFAMAKKTMERVSPESKHEIEGIMDVVKMDLERAKDNFMERAEWMARGGPIIGTRFYNNAKLENVTNQEVHEIAAAWVEFFGNDIDTSDKTYTYNHPGGAPKRTIQGVWKSSEVDTLDRGGSFMYGLYDVNFAKMKDENLKKAIMHEAEDIKKRKALETKEFQHIPTEQELETERRAATEARLADLEKINAEQAEIIIRVQEAQRAEAATLRELIQQMQNEIDRQRVEFIADRTELIADLTEYLAENLNSAQIAIKMAERANRGEAPTRVRNVGNTELDKSTPELRDELADMLDELGNTTLTGTSDEINTARQDATRAVMAKYGLNETEAAQVINAYTSELSEHMESGDVDEKTMLSARGNIGTTIMANYRGMTEAEIWAKLRENPDLIRNSGMTESEINAWIARFMSLKNKDPESLIGLVKINEKNRAPIKAELVQHIATQATTGMSIEEITAGSAALAEKLGMTPQELAEIINAEVANHEDRNGQNSGPLSNRNRTTSQTNQTSPASPNGTVVRIPVTSPVVGRPAEAEATPPIQPVEAANTEAPTAETTTGRRRERVERMPTGLEIMRALRETVQSEGYNADQAKRFVTEALRDLQATGVDLKNLKIDDNYIESWVNKPGEETPAVETEPIIATEEIPENSSKDEKKKKGKKRPNRQEKNRNQDRFKVGSGTRPQDIVNAFENE